MYDGEWHTFPKETMSNPQKNLFQRLSRVFLIVLFCLTISGTLESQTPASGGPGKDANWSTAGKQAIGTSATLESRIWFTLAQGTMTEVYFPDVTVANVQTLQFVVVDPKTRKVETERDDAIHQIKLIDPNSLSFQQTNTAKSGTWTITKTYTTDPGKSAVVMIDVKFESKNKLHELYYYYDPSIGNTGMHDSGTSADGKVVAFDGKIFSSLLISTGSDKNHTGFLGTSDGIDQLRKSGEITDASPTAKNGNVVQMGRITSPKRFTAILSFADSEAEAIRLSAAAKATGFAMCLATYAKGWADYTKTLPSVEPKYQAQFNMAAMVIKAQEDKTVRGANVASLTVPWGGGVNANEDVGGGYHLIWARDLYHVFTAYLALGDRAAAERALDFLFKVQQKEDGSFPQNSQITGTGGWGSLQMDEVGYPLIMAWQLGRFDKKTYERHVKRAADFIVKTGPSTPQERWEERPGYSPSTIAAEIAGLVCAADIAKRNGDTASAATYLKTADVWQANIEKWTATTTGKYGDGNYYVRITKNGRPDAGEMIELNNNAGTFPETEIVDAGFLELVRLGIKPADDPLIAKSLQVIDELIKVDTPNGPAFYRYNKDGYGEMDDGRRWNWDGKYTGKGRPWPLLSGERGQYELAVANSLEQNPIYPDSRISKAQLKKRQALDRLDNMLAFANDGLMIPEQVWDKKEIPANVDNRFIPELKFGEGTGSATPLAWSMAQFIRLATNLKAGRNLDTPQVVYDRYVLGKR